MIASFKNQDVENLFNGIRVARFVNIETVAMRKLAMLMMLRLWIIIEIRRMTMREVAYPTAGEILLEEFLIPMGITQYRLAKEIGVPQARIGEIVAGKRAVTVDAGLRLSRYFGMNDSFWTGLQMDYDTAMQRELLSETLTKIKPLEQHVA